ncbi:galactose mutarotase [Flavobacteriaceae bacterium]|nr:galactose mutarotase [Flavobacteriaceae bacterium]
MKEIVLTNRDLKVIILPYGGIIKELWYQGTNVVIGKKNAEEYLENPWYMGACIGRYAGRLASGYSIVQDQYTHKKENAIQLHGGTHGWDKAVWKIYDLYHGTVPHVVLEYECLEKDSGHPGDVNVSLKYSLHGNTLMIEYKAKTTRPTPINITNHSYFNLSGAPNLGDHELMILSDEVLELDNNLLPTGVINTVKKTDFDRNLSRPVGSSRYDDCFVLREKEAINVRLKANSTKIQMDIITDQPGLVVFNPKELNGICFEAQKFPNAPNIPHFPNTIVRPEEKYTQKTQFILSKF